MVSSPARHLHVRMDEKVCGIFRFQTCQVPAEDVPRFFVVTRFEALTVAAGHSETPAHQCRFFFSLPGVSFAVFAQTFAVRLGQKRCSKAPQHFGTGAWRASSAGVCSGCAPRGASPPCHQERKLQPHLWSNTTSKQFLRAPSESFAPSERGVFIPTSAFGEVIE